jgi:hypothetical protein
MRKRFMKVVFDMLRRREKMIKRRGCGVAAVQISSILPEYQDLEYLTRGKKVVKRRPQQSNRNRIVLPPRPAPKGVTRGQHAAYCTQVSRFRAHNLRNSSPIGTGTRTFSLPTRRRYIGGDLPCFSDANCRRGITPNPHGQTVHPSRRRGKKVG